LQNNQYFGWGSHTSLIYANSQQNVLNIKDSTFENNNMIHNNTLVSCHFAALENNNIADILMLTIFCPF